MRSRREIERTHLLVTTPEKWDVITRKTGEDVLESVRLLIIDEVHLVGEDRGPVIEAIVARTLPVNPHAFINYGVFVCECMEADQRL